MYELPDVFDRVEFGALGRQCDDADVGGHLEFACHVSSGLIHQHDRVRPRCDGERDFGEVQCHGLGVAEGQDQPGALAVFRTDCAEDIGRLRALVLRRRGPGSAPRLKEASYQGNVCYWFCSR